MVASPSTQSVCFCLTDAMLASREESEQPSMTNQDRGPALTVSSVPCTVWLSRSLERRSLRVWLYIDTVHTHPRVHHYNAHTHTHRWIFLLSQTDKPDLDCMKLFSQLDNNLIGRSQSVVKNLHAWHTAWHLNTQTNHRKPFIRLLSSENSVNAILQSCWAASFPNNLSCFQIDHNNMVCSVYQSNQDETYLICSGSSKCW